MFKEADRSFKSGRKPDKPMLSAFRFECKTKAVYKYPELPPTFKMF